MRARGGFTLLELLAVVGIIGILGATAMPLYRTYQQRAYGSEAAIMAKRIIDGQIAYFLEHDQFFPEPSYGGDNPIFISSNTSANDPAIADIYNALNITITVGHFLDYHLAAINTPGDESFTVTIMASFPLFQGQQAPGTLIGSVNKDGEITMIVP